MNLSSYLPLLVDLMLKSVVLFGVAWMAAWFARQVSAANRHLIWLAAFGQVLALPFLAAWVAGEAGPAPASGRPETAIVLTLPAETAPRSGVKPALPVAEPVSPWHAAMQWGSDHWRDGAVGAWLGGVVALLAWRMAGAMRLWLLKRRSPLVGDARIKAWALRIAVEQGPRRRVELRFSAECPVAMTWGTVRPVVMLPAEASAWSDERLELVLRHELAHVMRRDCLVRLLGQVACALYWPNPLAWLGARRLRLEQEQACDDRVLAAGAEAKAYAEELLAGARALAGRGWKSRAAVAMAEPSILETRILGIVDERRDRGAAHRVTMAFALVAAALALTGCAALRVREGASAAGVAGEGKVQEKPIVEIEARFIQFEANTPEAKAVLAELEKMDGYMSASGTFKEGLSPEAADALMRYLSKRVGAGVLSSPKITQTSGSSASITVAQELRDPKVPGDVAGAAENHSSGAGVMVTPGSPEDFATTNVGVEMKASPRVGNDGWIELTLEAKVTSFESFVEFAPGPWEVRSPDGTTVAKGEVPPGGPVFQPVFSTIERTLTERIQSGRSVVFQLGQMTPMPKPMVADSPQVAIHPSPDAFKDKVVLAFVTATEVSRPKRAAGGGVATAKSTP